LDERGICDAFRISSLLVGDGVGVNVDALDTNRIFGSVLLVDLNRLHLVEGVPAFYYATKDGVLSIKVRGLVESNEKLAAVGVGTLVGHAQDTALVVLELRFDLIFKRLTVDARTILGCSGSRRTSLDHEGWDEAMEGRVIVGVGCAKGEKVVGRLWAGAAEELEFEIAVGCVQRDCHDC
jgi:hypothetical protein